jgi:hypothetical protein
MKRGVFACKNELVYSHIKCKMCLEGDEFWDKYFLEICLANWDGGSILQQRAGFLIGDAGPRGDKKWRGEAGSGRSTARPSRSSVLLSADHFISTS